MPFNIVLQTSASEPERVDKSLTDIATLSGELRDSTSIIDPVFLISGDLANYTGCNYLTVPSFGRSYFVRNIVSVRTGVIQISAHVDVLSSFKTQLRTNVGIIRKSERNWNLYLNDGSLQTFQYSDVNTIPFPYGFPNNKQYILAMAGT